MTNNFRHFGYMLHFYIGDVVSNNTAVDNPNLDHPLSYTSALHRCAKFALSMFGVAFQ